MKAILIDPKSQQLLLVPYTKGNYRQIYTLLSTPLHPVTCFTLVHIENSDCIFVDDEGLLKDSASGDPTNYFRWATYPQPLCGRGLILGTDSEGESVTPKTTLTKARKMVTWPHALYKGSITRTTSRGGWTIISTTTDFDEPSK